MHEKSKFIMEVYKEEIVVAQSGFTLALASQHRTKIVEFTKSTCDKG